MNGYMNLNPNINAINITFNEITVEELKANTYYAGKLKKVQTINMKNMSDFPHLHCNNWSDMDGYDMINLAYEMNFKYAIVWADGSWPTGDDFDDALLAEIDEWNENGDWLCAGHIIAHQDRYPHFHQQCVVVNLKKWKEIGRPEFETWHLKSHPAWICSKETINSKYTPVYIEPNNSQPSTKIQDGWSGDFMDSLIPAALHAGCRVYNLPYSIRDHKYCCYPEDDVAITAAWLLDENFRESFDDPQELADFKYSHVSEDKRDLYSYKLLDTAIVYITNTESIPQTPKLGITLMVAPCSGLHQFQHIIGALDTIQEVQWTDFSEYGVTWTRHLLENWDGRNFTKFFEDNKSILYDMGFGKNSNMWYQQDNVDEFFEQWSEDEWLELWDKIRAIKHNFKVLDIVKDYQTVIDSIEDTEVVHIQLSNIWQYEINYLNTRGFQAQLNFVSLIDGLIATNKDVYFSGDTPNGVFYEYQDMKLLPGIL